jgi:hypothetical protein
MTDVVLFCFAGRTPNMRLNVPLVRRILEEHPDTRCDIWNLARNQLDAIYLQTVAGGRIRVLNDFWRNRAYEAVYRHYAQPEYRDCLFAKFDDDVVFMQTERFGDFIGAVKANPGTVVSPLVINNGASTRVEPGLWRGYKALGIPLLEVHTDVRFAEMAHQYFFDHHAEVLGRPVQLINTDDWVSINMIGFDHLVVRRMARRLEGPSPRRIAGRDFTATDRLGDEGAANLFPRKILQGFTVAHLGFGPQEPSVEQFERWRENYARIGANYLTATQKVVA